MLSRFLRRKTRSTQVPRVVLIQDGDTIEIWQTFGCQALLVNKRDRFAVLTSQQYFTHEQIDALLCRAYSTPLIEGAAL